MLNIIGKLVKALIANWLYNTAEKYSLLSAIQIRARRERFIEIALKLLIEQIYII